MADQFTLESVKEFMILNGGKVKNHELVTYFKTFLNDQQRKDEMREKFKSYVNTLATIKVDEQNDKVLVLKKKYRPDSGSGNPEWDRARSEPPGGQEKTRSQSSTDLTDGSAPSRVKSDGNLSASDLRLSASTLSSNFDNGSVGSAISTSSLSSATTEEDGNLSVMSVKERAKHLNRMESESEIQQMTTSPLGATRLMKKETKKTYSDGDDSSGGYVTLEPLEKEWLVTSSSAEYHPMNQLLSKHPHLVKIKDFTTGHNALHWAAKHGRPEVVKMLMSKPGVNVNQRTNGGYTALHLAAQHGHEDIIELLVHGFKADPNIRDYSGKKPKQYLRNSASSRTQRSSIKTPARSMSVPNDKLCCQDDKLELLVSSRLGAKPSSDKLDGGFLRNTAGRRSNRASAIKSLIQASATSMKQTVMRSSWGSLEDVNTTPRSSPSISPRNSAEPSPTQRRKGSFSSRDRELMPPPSGASRNKSRRPPHSISKESLYSEDRKTGLSRQVLRSESEPNLGDVIQPSKTTFI